MPYPKGDRLPGERASRLGHLDVLNSGLVKSLCEAFESGPGTFNLPPTHGLPLPTDGAELPLVFGVAGPGRALEDGAVKSGGGAGKPGRAVDEGAVKTSTQKKAHARAIESGTVKSQGTSDKASRAAEKANK